MESDFVNFRKFVVIEFKFIDEGKTNKVHPLYSQQLIYAHVQCAMPPRASKSSAEGSNFKEDDRALSL